MLNEAYHAEMMVIQAIHICTLWSQINQIWAIFTHLIEVVGRGS